MDSWFLNIRDLVFTVPGAETPRIKAQADSVCGENPLLGHKLPSLRCVLRGQTEPKIRSRCLFDEGANLTHEGSTLVTGPPSKYHCVGNRVSAFGFGGDASSQ